MAFQATGTPSAQGSAPKASNSSPLGNGMVYGARHFCCLPVNRSWSMVLAMVLYFSCTGALWAQNEVETQPDKEVVEGGIRQAPTEIYLLKDKNGEFVKVATNLLLEEYLRIYNLQNQIETPNTPPAYAIEEGLLAGRATRLHAMLTVNYRIRIVAENPGQWTRVPLKLKNSVMRQAPRYTGQGAFFVTWDAEQGHVGWIRGSADSIHNLSLDIIRPLRKAGQITQLQLDLPSTRCRCTSLIVPYSKAQFAPAELAVQTKVVDPNSTSFAFDFQGGDLQVSWSANEQSNSQPFSRLQAQVLTRFNVRGKQNMTAHGEVTVDGLGSNVSSFEVLLPPSMQLVNLPNPEYRVTVSGTEMVQSGDPSVLRQRVLVVMNRAAPQVTVSLEALYQPGLTSEESAVPASPSKEGVVSFTGFEVVDTVKQSGSLLITSDANWAVWWQASGDVRRRNPLTDVLPADLPSRTNVAFFEYYNLSYTVAGTIRPQTTQLRIKPQLLFKVAASEIRLEVELYCQYVGNGQYELSMEYPGWEFDQVFQRKTESLTLVDSQTADGKVTFSLMTVDEETRGELAIVLRARRFLDLTAAQNDIPLRLPAPVITATGAGSATVNQAVASVVIQGADNIEITPKVDEMKGLVLGASKDLDAFTNLTGGQTPLIYHARPDQQLTGPVEFHGALRLRQRSLLVASHSLIRLDEEFASFQQTLEFQIAYEPIRQVKLRVPGIVRNPQNLRVFLEVEDPDETEDKPVNLLALPWSIIPSSSIDDQRRSDLQTEAVSVDLLSEYRGRVRLVLHYQQQLPQLLSDSSQTVNFLLVAPEVDPGIQLVRNAVTLDTQDVFFCQAVDDIWQMDRSTEVGTIHADLLHLKTTQPTTSVPIAMRLRRDVALNTTELQRRWAQTILTEQGCRERVAMVIRTNDVFVRIQFPMDVRFDSSSLVMAVNGQRVPFDQIVLNRNRQLLLRLASERREDEYRIEAWYTRSGIEPQRLQIELPEVIGARNSGRTYWQIVMAADRHLFKSPAMMTAEHVWQWTGLWWSREAALNQQSLEQWTGVDEQLMPVGQFNQYLFSTVGSVSAFEVTSFQRWSLLLVVSGIVLVIGLFVLFVPWLHRPVTLLVIGIVLTAMAVWIPELVLLVLQSALAGIVLVGLARLLHVSLRRNLGPVAAAGPVATLDTNSAVLSLLDGSRLGIRSDTERAAEDLHSDKSESELQAGVVAGSVSEKQA